MASAVLKLTIACTAVALVLTYSPNNLLCERPVSIPFCVNYPCTVWIKCMCKKYHVAFNCIRNSVDELTVAVNDYDTKRAQQIYLTQITTMLHSE